MKYLLITLLTLNAQAALQMNPGLWEVKSIIKADGQVVDPQAGLKKLMTKMTPERRKRFETAMAANLSSNGLMQVCFTKDMLANEGAFMQEESKSCDLQFADRTATKVSMTFKCKNGSNGNANWNIKSGGKAYDGQMNFTYKTGKKSEVTHEGKWVSADCGKVKPVNFKQPSPLKK